MKLKNTILTLLVVSTLAGCAGIKVYDQNGQKMKHKGVQIKEVDTWLAIGPDGSTKMVEIPTGKEREIVPFNFLSRSNISINVRESGSLESLGQDSDATGATEAIRSAISRDFIGHAGGEGEEIPSLILIKASSLNTGTIFKLIVYPSGRVEQR